MIRGGDGTIRLAEGRFERFGRIAWWDQDRLRAARVLVVGAGALGNEVIKDLALLGVGHLAIVDRDRVEEVNLSRSVLFRDADRGRFKAEAAAEAARELYPDIRAIGLVGNVLADVGLGRFRWAEVVVGALDNREARLFVNAACAMLGRPWIDGGIDVLSGVVRAFEPPRTACYECTMGEADWRQLDQRRSCSLLARLAATEGGVPTTPTTASVIGAIQAQEVVKRLHGLESLAGSGFVFEGLAHSSYNVAYPINPACPWHQPPAPVEAVGQFGMDTPLGELCDYAAGRLGGLDAIDLGREMVAGLDCPACKTSQRVFRSIEHVSEDEAVCPACRGELAPRLVHSFTREPPWPEMTVRELGLPEWDIVWARWGEDALGIELAPLECGDSSPL